MTLGSRIAEYRKKQSITQETLAKQLGVTNQAVSKWESDQCCPDVMLLPKIADIFNITMDALFGREFQTNATVFNMEYPDDHVLRVAVYVGNKLVCGGPGEGCQYHYHGTVDGVSSCVSITCGDVMGNVDAEGNVTCGKVMGSVDAGGNVSCENVEGNVDAGGSVNCADVTGSVDAGTEVRCADVGSYVDAGGNVTCGNVTGDVDAGGRVECGNVGGDIDAGGSVTIKK